MDTYPSCLPLTIIHHLSLTITPLLLMRRYKSFILLLYVWVGMLTLSACGSSKQVVYFQDLKPGETEITLPEPKAITVRPEDKISIIVNSRDPGTILTEWHNQREQSRRFGLYGECRGGNRLSGARQDSGGRHEAGRNSRLYQAEIDGREPGERPGRDRGVCQPLHIDRDRLTILDALSLAGDLTIYGNRSKVLVLRQEGEVQRVYGLNLTSGEHIYTSPAYYLQQNDVVYVEPNAVKARQSTVNGNNVRLLTSVAILVFN